LKIGSGSAQKGTKHDGNENVACSFRGVNQRGRIEPSEIVVPANAYIAIKSG